MRMKEAEVKTLISISQSLRMLGASDDSATALEQARRISEERGYDDHLQEVRTLLGDGP
jgi:hypothetical protein